MDAYIVKAYRTAVGRAKKGGFRFVRSEDLAVDVIKHMMSQTPDLDPHLVDDVIVGCANPEGEQGLQIGRQISLRALGKPVPGMTVNRYCASGLETISIAVAKVKAGMGEVYIAGGAESMSVIPMTGYNKYGVSREDQDEFSYNSHVKAANALDKGFFKEEIVPVNVKEVYFEDNQRKEREYTVNEDEGVRRSTTAEGLAKLRPVFAQGGSVTAGNSSQMSDGAAFVLVMSERMVKELNLEPIARLVSCSVAGVEPLYMGIGPCAAIPKALKQADLKLNDIEQIELNEAFAAQSLAVIREAGLNPDIVNVNGGAIALGHPLGCTGAKLSTQLFNEMRRRKQKYGMVTACVGGGQGIAGIYELLN